MSGKTYVILGGGGSFAINTALYLLRREDTARVIGVGRAPLRPRAFTLGVEDNQRFEYRAHHIWYEKFTLLDLLDREQPDVIINFAAQGEGAASWSRSSQFFMTNCVALSRLYEDLEDRPWFNQGIGDEKPPCRFIHIGTSELYGSVTEPADESAPVVPTSPYAASKAAFDMYLLALRGVGRATNATILRPSNCYGPGQLLHRIIPRAIVCGLTGRRLPLHGAGAASKSYIHISDLAHAIYLVAGADPNKLSPIYNVGPRMPISIHELAQLCAHAVNVPFDNLFEVAEERVGQDSCYWLDSSAIQNDLGWRNMVGLQDGLLEVADWARDNLDALRDWPQDYELRP